MVKKFIWVFPDHLPERYEWTFWPTQYFKSFLGQAPWYDLRLFATLLLLLLTSSPRKISSPLLGCWSSSENVTGPHKLDPFRFKVWMIIVSNVFRSLFPSSLPDYLTNNIDCSKPFPRGLGLLLKSRRRNKVCFGLKN